MYKLQAYLISVFDLKPNASDNFAFHIYFSTWCLN